MNYSQSESQSEKLSRNLPTVPALVGWDKDEILLLRYLREANRYMAQIDDLDELWTYVLTTALDLVEGQYGAIILSDDRGRFSIRMSQSLSSADAFAAERSIDLDALGESMGSGTSWLHESKRAMCVRLEPLAQSTVTTYLRALYVSTLSEQAHFSLDNLALLDAFASEASSHVHHCLQLDYMKQQIDQQSAELVALRQLLQTETEKMLHQSEEQLRRTLSRLPVPISLSRRDGTFVHVNEGFCELFGGSYKTFLHDMNGRDVFLDPKSRDAVVDMYSQDGEVARFQNQYKRIDGSTFWAIGVGHEIQYQGKAALLGCYIDSTQHKNLEKALLSAKEAAESANETKGMFLSNMTHELRTPMNGVIGMTSLLLDTPLNDEQRDLIGTLRQSGDVLLRLINDILDFSKIEAGKLSLEKIPFDLKNAITQTIDLFKATLQAKVLPLTLTIDNSVPPVLIQDVTRLRQTITNLVANAIKFTDVGAIEIGVTATPLTAENYQIQFSVKDSGIGIPSDQLEGLFDSFSQADVSTTRRFGGTGLGLAISKQLAELMGGTMWVESEMDVGSTFYFTIHAKSTTHTECTSHHHAPKFDPHMATENPLRILLAEDNVINQKVALFILQKYGYSADLAINGIEVLDALKHLRYDLILMDIQMPEMDGVTATQRIRRDWPPEQQPTIIALTASTTKEQRERFIQAGLDDFVSKPIQVTELVAALKRISSRSSAVSD